MLLLRGSGTSWNLCRGVTTCWSTADLRYVVVPSLHSYSKKTPFYVISIHIFFTSSSARTRKNFDIASCPSSTVLSKQVCCSNGIFTSRPRGRERGEREQKKKVRKKWEPREFGSLSLFLSLSPPPSPSDRGHFGTSGGTGTSRQREPNQQRTPNKLPTELRCRNIVGKRRLSIANRRQTCKDVYAMRTYSDWASIFHAPVGGWEGEEEKQFFSLPGFAQRE